MRRPIWQDMERADKTKMVTRLVFEGYSARQIADHFSGATRNAVIGYSYRNGINLGMNRNEKISLAMRRVHADEPVKARPRSSASEFALRPVSAASIGPEPKMKKIALIEATAEHCRWPLWDDLPDDPGEALYCGNQVIKGRSYCDYHAKLSAGHGTERERTAHRVLLRESV